MIKKIIFVSSVLFQMMVVSAFATWQSKIMPLLEQNDYCKLHQELTGLIKTNRDSDVTTALDEKMDIEDSTCVYAPLLIYGISDLLNKAATLNKSECANIYGNILTVLIMFSIDKYVCAMTDYTRTTVPLYTDMAHYYEWHVNNRLECKNSSNDFDLIKESIYNTFDKFSTLNVQEIALPYWVYAINIPAYYGIGIDGWAVKRPITFAATQPVVTNLTQLNPVFQKLHIEAFEQIKTKLADIHSWQDFFAVDLTLSCE